MIRRMGGTCAALAPARRGRLALPAELSKRRLLAQKDAQVQFPEKVTIQELTKRFSRNNAQESQRGARQPQTN